MTSTVEAPPTEPRLASHRPLHRRRSVTNTVFVVAVWVAFALVTGALGAVLAFVIVKGAPVVSWQFLTTSPIQIRADQPDTAQVFGLTLRYGMWPAIVGTVLITGMATLLAVPLGVMGGIYLNEYGARSRFAAVVRFLADVMTGVPSVVMGLFVFTVLVLPLHQRTGFAGAAALACLMVPIVIRSTEEMLRLVPDDIREASYGLGASQSRTILRVVLPSALPGIVSGALLAIARAAGETAPLLFTIGIVSATNPNLFSGPNTALSTQIFANASSPFPAAIARGWGAALVLIAITFAFTLLARLVVALFRKRQLG
jgi:phosphate transport system permease protein